MADDDRTRGLWCAVILQAIEDATGEATPLGTAGIGRDLARTYARHWLLECGEDFNAVCLLAGLEPERVRQHAQRSIEAADERKGKGISLRTRRGRKPGEGRDFDRHAQDRRGPLARDAA